MLHHLLSAAGSSPAAAASAAARIADKLGMATKLGALSQTVSPQFRAAARRQRCLISCGATRTRRSSFSCSHVRRWNIWRRGCGRKASGIARFDGSMSGPDKDAAIAIFREQSAVLLCTQTGGEGRNIQFCNTLINFDVPWNPMAIEQRIGRIDRIGQTREVFVFNLVRAAPLKRRCWDC